MLGIVGLLREVAEDRSVVLDQVDPVATWRYDPSVVDVRLRRRTQFDHRRILRRPGSETLGRMWMSRAGHHPLRDDRCLTYNPNARATCGVATPDGRNWPVRLNCSAVLVGPAAR